MTDPAVTISLVLGYSLLCGLFTILVLRYSSLWLQLRVPKSGAGLPQGSFGWPLLGETFALLQDPLGFAVSHQQRYGSIFKTSLFMRKCIVGTTPEFAKFVTLNSTLFPTNYPPSLQFTSPNAILFHDGPRHAAVKKFVTKVGLPESVKPMIHTLERIILENLALGVEKETVLASDVTEKLVAETSSYVALGIDNIRSTPEGAEQLKNIITVFEAISALPINLPGTAHYKGLKAVAALRVYLQSCVQQRRMQDDAPTDMLRILIDGAREEEKYLSDESIIDEITVAWLGAYKSVMTTLNFSLKFLVDYPDICTRIRAEQQEILRGKDLSLGGPRLTLEDMKKMVYTTKFFQEVQRKLSIAFTVSRKAAQDTVYDGFLIPKGWGVLPMTCFVHNDPANYEDPAHFNPDRFDAAPKAQTYLPFGSGAHRCPGEGIAKALTLILIHHITTTYKHESVGPDRGAATKSAFPIIVGGYPIKVSLAT